MSEITPDLVTSRRSKDKIHANERMKGWSSLRSAPVQRRENPKNKSKSNGRGRLRNEAASNWNFESVKASLIGFRNAIGAMD